MMEAHRFSIHGRVRIGVPESFPHKHALRREFESFRDDTVMDLNLEITRLRDFNPKGRYFRLSPNGPAVSIFADNVVLACDNDPLQYVLPLVEWLLLKDGCSLAHAAGVSIGERGVLLPAIGGVGKTAAVCELCRVKGGGFLGDDLVIVSSKGQVLSFPKPLFLYPYHQELFPHVFASRKKFVVPSWLSGAVAGLRTLVRPMLRRLPRLEEFGRRHTPEHIHTPANEALPNVECVESAPLSLVLFLERYDGSNPNLSEESASSLADEMIRILAREIGAPARAVLEAADSSGVIPKSEYEGKMHEVLQSAMVNVALYRLRLPRTISAVHTAAIVREQALSLLAAPR